jgi:hypothetical protein
MSNGNKMDDLMDMIVADESPSNISDKIKDMSIFQVGRKN